MLIMGNRDDIDQVPATSATVLTTVLKLIDKYDLLGEVWYPKHHKQLEVADIYRISSKTKVYKTSCQIIKEIIHYCSSNWQKIWSLRWNDFEDFKILRFLWFKLSRFLT